MKNDARQFDEIIALADALCSGRATAEEASRLEALLKADAAVRRAYLRYLSLHADLTSAGAVVKAAAEPREARAGLRLRWAVWSMRAAAVVMLASAVAWMMLRSDGPGAVATLMAAEDGAMLRWAGPRGVAAVGARLGPGTLWVEGGEATLRFEGGAMVKVAGGSMLCIEAADRATLMRGGAAVRAEGEAAGFVMKTPTVKVTDLSTAFRVSLSEAGRTEVRVTEGAVRTEPLAARPLWCWTFDEPQAEVRERMTGAGVKWLGAARRAAGVIGEGAASFDNSHGCGVDVSSAAAKAGGFAAATGVTIEAVIVSGWSGRGHSTGEKSDYDEIFRKDDGDYRILLSFQNDDHTAVRRDVPIASGPVLSFGIHLAGRGYSELDVPLDGREGRPTVAEICDGRPHHVAATYDSATGRKTVYVDGRAVMSAAFPAGTSVISRGTAPMIIGNHQNGREPFTGLIDEAALYEMALPAETVAEHAAAMRRGESSLRTEKRSMEAVERLEAGEVRRY